MITNPKIYVADLAAYNNGILHGVWIEDLLDIEEIRGQVSIMLQQSPICNSEEYAVHDYEGFGELRLNEFISLERINQLALFLHEHPESGDIVLNYCNDDIDEANRLLDDCYQGIYDSVEAYAQEIGEECFPIPAPLKYHIDWSSFARDMLLSGDIHAVEKQSKVLIFAE